jgi:hypothetical protein
MRSMFRSVLLALVAALAVCGVAAASASASPAEWLLNGAPVTESTLVTLSLKSGTTVTLADKTPEGGTFETKITCSGFTGKGTVAPAGAGKITEFKLSKCTRTKQGICEAETKAQEESKEWVKAIKLPWETRLAERNASTAEFLLKGNGPGASAGWEFECKAFGFTVKDECRALQEDAEILQEGTGVDVRFRAFPSGFSIAGWGCKTGVEALRSSAGELVADLIVKGPEGKTLSFKV